MKARYLTIVLAFITILSVGFGGFRQRQWVQQQSKLADCTARSEQYVQNIMKQSTELEKAAEQLEKTNRELARALEQYRTTAQKSMK